MHTRPSIAALAAFFTLLAALVAAPPARAGWSYDGTLTVSAGATNASEVAVIRGGDSATNRLSEVERVEAYHASGAGTGTVQFAVQSLSGAWSAVSAATLTSGGGLDDYPVRHYAAVAAGVTNAHAAPYQARYLRVYVSQPAHPAPAVYRWRVTSR